jgi:hypothetical protein
MLACGTPDTFNALIFVQPGGSAGIFHFFYLGILSEVASGHFCCVTPLHHGFGPAPTQHYPAGATVEKL